MSTEQLAARLFSAASFRPIFAGRNSSKADLLIKKLGEELSLRTASRAAVVASAYRVLSRGYRGEYLYRNLITSRYFVGKHRASNSVLLHELRVGGSIADCVLVNGHGNVYEIKTERDDPSRLALQVMNYKMAFPSVNLVVNEADQHKYSTWAGDLGLGLITLTRRGHLSVQRAADEDYSGLDIRAMFNLLRVEELATVLNEHHGFVPDVPNGRRYEAFLEQAEAIPAPAFQKSMQSVLKMRHLKHSRPLLMDRKMEPLRAIISQLDPTKLQQDRLLDWLSVREA
ncbi:sce7726 family protein [Leucobacter sp. GX24907]